MKEPANISANEINKFLYCPYQWYYERTLGTKRIRALYRERNERLGYYDATAANINRGLDHHAYYRRNERRRRLVFALIAAALLSAACYLGFRLWG